MRAIRRPRLASPFPVATRSPRPPHALSSRPPNSALGGLLRAALLTTTTPTRPVKAKDTAIKTRQQMMWERVVPASARMLDFLAREQAGSTDRLVSAFQLMRFHLCRHDLRAAKELLSSMLGDSFPSKKTEELRPLLRMLMEAYSQAGDGNGAMWLKNRMAEVDVPLDKDIYLSMLRACSTAGSGVSMKQYCHLLKEGESEGWSKTPEAYIGLLFMMAREKQDAPSSLPSIDEVWSSITAAGEPSLRAIAARVEATAALSHTSTPITEALSGLMPPTQVMGTDIPMVQHACAVAAHTLIRLGDASGLRKALEVVRLSEVSLAQLLQSARSAPDSLGLSTVVLSFCNPSGPTAVLASCHAALAQGDDAAVSQAVDQALRLSPSDWAQTCPDEVAKLLYELQARGGDVEVLRSLGQAAAAARRKSVPAPLVKSLLRFASMEGQPGRTLPLLRKLGSNVMVEDYHHVLVAAGSTKFPPRSTRERSFLEDPEAFLKWLLADMLGRGVVAETATVNAAVGVFRRACEWVEMSRVRKGEEEASTRNDGYVDAAIDFVNACAKGGGEVYALSRAVEPDDETFVGLVEVAVMGKRGMRMAEKLIQQMEQNGAALEPMGRAYTALVSAILLRGNGVMDGEQAMVRMVNRGLAPNDVIMDAFAESYRRADNVASGLSLLQGCFNQYGCRPSPEVFLELVHHCLEKGDRFEAQRAAHIAEQFWSGATEEVRVEVLKQIEVGMAGLLPPSNSSA